MHPDEYVKKAREYARIIEDIALDIRLFVSSTPHGPLVPGNLNAPAIQSLLDMATYCETGVLDSCVSTLMTSDEMELLESLERAEPTNYQMRNEYFSNVI